MDYFKHYESLLQKATNRGTKKQHLNFYTEKHRGFPGCFGGKYQKHNIFLLTAEEHFVAHQLLVKMFPDEDDLVFACHKMTHDSNGKRINNKMYSWLKKRHLEVASKIGKSRTGEKNGSFGKSWYYNPETLENGKVFPEDVPGEWVKGRIKNWDNNTPSWYYNKKTLEEKILLPSEINSDWIKGRKPYFCLFCNKQIEGDRNKEYKFCSQKHKNLYKQEEFFNLKNDFIKLIREGKFKSFSNTLKEFGYHPNDVNKNKILKEWLEEYKQCGSGGIRHTR